MKVVISPRAEKQLRKIPKVKQIYLAQKIRSLIRVSNPSQEEKLQGYKDIYRVRLGNYRIVYRRQAATLYIITIAHRKDVYRLLQDLLK